MKTLVNKANPAIRIIAPEIGTYREFYTLPDKDFHHLFKMENWTLVEEEENISWAERLKERLSKMSQEEIDKAFEEMGGDNDEFPTLEEYLKAAYHSPIETEPVDLEKELQAFLCNYDYEFDDDDPVPFDIARHFYELGLKARKEE